MPNPSIELENLWYIYRYHSFSKEEREDSLRRFLEQFLELTSSCSKTRIIAILSYIGLDLSQIITQLSFTFIQMFNNAINEKCSPEPIVCLLCNSAEIEEYFSRQNESFSQQENHQTKNNDNNISIDIEEKYECGLGHLILKSLCYFTAVGNFQVVNGFSKTILSALEILHDLDLKLGFISTFYSGESSEVSSSPRSLLSYSVMESIQFHCKRFNQTNISQPSHARLHSRSQSPSSSPLTSPRYSSYSSHNTIGNSLSDIPQYFEEFSFNRNDDPLLPEIDDHHEDTRCVLILLEYQLLNKKPAFYQVLYESSMWKVLIGVISTPSELLSTQHLIRITELCSACLGRIFKWGTDNLTTVQEMADMGIVGYIIDIVKERIDSFSENYHYEEDQEDNSSENSSDNSSNSLNNSKLEGADNVRIGLLYLVEVCGFVIYLSLYVIPHLLVEFESNDGYDILQSLLSKIVQISPDKSTAVFEKKKVVIILRVFLFLVLGIVKRFQEVSITTEDSIQHDGDDHNSSKHHIVPNPHMFSITLELFKDAVIDPNIIEIDNNGYIRSPPKNVYCCKKEILTIITDLLILYPRHYIKNLHDTEPFHIMCDQFIHLYPQMQRMILRCFERYMAIYDRCVNNTLSSSWDLSSRGKKELLGILFRDMKEYCNLLLFWKTSSQSVLRVAAHAKATLNSPSKNGIQKLFRKAGLTKALVSVLEGKERYNYEKTTNDSLIQTDFSNGVDENRKITLEPEEDEETEQHKLSKKVDFNRRREVISYLLEVLYAYLFQDSKNHTSFLEHEGSISILYSLLYDEYLIHKTLKILRILSINDHDQNYTMISDLVHMIPPVTRSSSSSISSISSSSDPYNDISKNAPHQMRKNILLSLIEIFRHNHNAKDSFRKARGFKVVLSTMGVLGNYFQDKCGSISPENTAANKHAVIIEGERDPSNEACGDLLFEVFQTLIMTILEALREHYENETYFKESKYFFGLQKPIHMMGFMKRRRHCLVLCINLIQLSLLNTNVYHGSIISYNRLAEHDIMGLLNKPTASTHPFEFLFIRNPEVIQVLLHLIGQNLDNLSTNICKFVLDEICQLSRFSSNCHQLCSAGVVSSLLKYFSQVIQEPLYPIYSNIITLFLSLSKHNITVKEIENYFKLLLPKEFNEQLLDVLLQLSSAKRTPNYYIDFRPFLKSTKPEPYILPPTRSFLSRFNKDWSRHHIDVPSILFPKLSYSPWPPAGGYSLALWFRVEGFSSDLSSNADERNICLFSMSTNSQILTVEGIVNHDMTFSIIITEGRHLTQSTSPLRSTLHFTNCVFKKGHWYFLVINHSQSILNPRIVHSFGLFVNGIFFGTQNKIYTENSFKLFVKNMLSLTHYNLEHISLGASVFDTYFSKSSKNSPWSFLKQLGQTLHPSNLQQNEETTEDLEPSFSCFQIANSFMFEGVLDELDVFLLYWVGPNYVGHFEEDLSDYFVYQIISTRGVEDFPEEITHIADNPSNFSLSHLTSRLLVVFSARDSVVATRVSVHLQSPTLVDYTTMCKPTDVNREMRQWIENASEAEEEEDQIPNIPSELLNSDMESESISQIDENGENHSNHSNSENSSNNNNEQNNQNELKKKHIKPPVSKPPKPSNQLTIFAPAKADLAGNTDLVTRMTFKTHIYAVGGLQTIIALMLKVSTSEQQQKILSILVELLNQDPRNTYEMEEIKGFELLNRLMQQEGFEINANVLIITFEMVGVHVKLHSDSRLLKSVSGVVSNNKAFKTLIMDYRIWQRGSLETQKLFFKILDSLLSVNSEFHLSTFRHLKVLNTLFFILQLQTEELESDSNPTPLEPWPFTLISPLITLIKKIVPTPAEMNYIFPIFSYVLSSHPSRFSSSMYYEPDSVYSIRRAVFSALLTILEECQDDVLDLVIEQFPLEALIATLDVPDTYIRTTILKIFCLLLNRRELARELFRKYEFAYVIEEQLSQFSPSIMEFQVMFDILLGQPYESEHNIWELSAEEHEKHNTTLLTRPIQVGAVSDLIFPSFVQPIVHLVPAIKDNQGLKIDIITNLFKIFNSVSYQAKSHFIEEDSHRILVTCLSPYILCGDNQLMGCIYKGIIDLLKFSITFDREKNVRLLSEVLDSMFLRLGIKDTIYIQNLQRMVLHGLLKRFSKSLERRDDKKGSKAIIFTRYSMCAVDHVLQWLDLPNQAPKALDIDAASPAPSPPDSPSRGSPRIRLFFDGIDENSVSSGAFELESFQSQPRPNAAMNEGNDSTEVQDELGSEATDESSEQIPPENTNKTSTENDFDSSVNHSESTENYGDQQLDSNSKRDSPTEIKHYLLTRQWYHEEIKNLVGKEETTDVLSEDYKEFFEFSKDSMQGFVYWLVECMETAIVSTKKRRGLSLDILSHKYATESELITQIKRLLLFFCHKDRTKEQIIFALLHLLHTFQIDNTDKTKEYKISYSKFFSNEEEKLLLYYLSKLIKFEDKIIQFLAQKLWITILKTKKNYFKKFFVQFPTEVSDESHYLSLKVNPAVETIIGEQETQMAINTNNQLNESIQSLTNHENKIQNRKARFKQRVEKCSMRLLETSQISKKPFMYRLRQMLDADQDNARQWVILLKIISRRTNLWGVYKLFDSMATLQNPDTDDEFIEYEVEHAPLRLKLDPTEGPFRMRIRIKRSTEGILEALMSSLTPSVPRKDSELFSRFQFSPSTILSNVGDPTQETETAPSPFSFNNGTAYRLQIREQIINNTQCFRITPLNTQEGEFVLTDLRLYFIADPYPNENVLRSPRRQSSVSVESRKQASSQKSFSFEDIREIHKRRYILKNSAMELFFTNGKTLFLAFDTVKQRDRAYSDLLDADLPNLINYLEEVNGGLILKKSITDKWREGSISNFEYLMHLNTLSGRSFNDITQYPVFPWILADYDSEELDLTNPNTFRDLSKPMGAQEPERLKKVLDRFEMMKEFEDQPPFHYGTHYSNKASVLFYLVRLEPFTQGFYELNGQLDLADRTFYNVGAAWKQASGFDGGQALSNVRELIPEFFCLPEFLTNSANIDFGKKQDGEQVHNVTLPPWAKGSPQLFIQKHREALESEYVSRHLHKWIDLIFGIKQRDKHAEEAYNLFHPLTYEGADVETSDDPIYREANRDQILMYGQTPKQLFKRVHPQRSANSALSRIDRSIVSQPDLVAPITFRSFKDAVGSIHVFDENYIVAIGRNKFFLPSSNRKDLLFVSLHHWDKTLRLCHWETNKVVSLYHNSSRLECFQCIAFSGDGKLMAAGSDSCTLQLFSIERPSKSSKTYRIRREGTLCGHTEYIAALEISSEFSVLVSACGDGNCILWDTNRQTFVTTLPHQGPVTCIRISATTGFIATYHMDRTTQKHHITLWSINGDLVAQREVSSRANCMEFTTIPEGITRNVLVLGMESKELVVLDALDLSPLKVIGTEYHQSPITALAINSSITEIFTGDDQGIIVSWKLDLLFSVKNVEVSFFFSSLPK